MSHMRSGWHTGAGVREDRGENLSLSTAAGKGEEKEEEEEEEVVVKGEVDGKSNKNMWRTMELQSCGIPPPTLAPASLDSMC